MCTQSMHGPSNRVFTDIFNLSLTESVIPTCFKQTTIVPVPRNVKVTCLNDSRPVALTSVAMKCFERLVMAHINTIIPETLDPLQFAYRPNRSTDDAISIALHTASGVVRVGNNTSTTLTLNMGAPQGCVLSPLLYSLFTHDCVADHDSNTITKFADATTA